MNCLNCLNGLNFAVAPSGMTSAAGCTGFSLGTLPNIGWHSFRHTVSAWGKEAGLELEEVKTLLRHENLATTSEVYGDLGMEAKRRIQQQLVNFVKQQATRVQ